LQRGSLGRGAGSEADRDRSGHEAVGRTAACQYGSGRSGSVRTCAIGSASPLHLWRKCSEVSRAHRWKRRQSCAVGAGAPRSFDGALAIASAYDAVFGWPAAWGTPSDVRDDLGL